MSKSLAQYRVRLIVLAAICFVIGLVSVVGFVRHMGQWQWEPYAQPLQMEAGEKVEGNFVAELDAVYEVEVKVDWVLSDEDLDRLIYRAEGTAPIDLSWYVMTQDGETVAKGDCRDYLYLSEGGRSFRDRLKGLLFRIPFYRESGEGTVSRGVGRFKAHAGQRYGIRAEVGTSLEALSPARPRLVVRLSREFWERQYESVKRKGKAGYLFLAVSGLLAGLWVFAVCLNSLLVGKKI